MGELQTARKLLPYPKPQGLVSAGPADMHELGESEELINEGFIDFMQVGVVNSTNWQGSKSFSISGSSLSTTTPFGGVAYLGDPVISEALMRVNTFGGPNPTNLSVLAPITIPSPPGEGKKKNVSLEIGALKWDRPPAYFLASEEGSIPAPQAGRVRLSYCAVENVGGTLTIVEPKGVYEAPEALPMGPSVGDKVELPTEGLAEGSSAGYSGQFARPTSWFVSIKATAASVVQILNRSRVLQEPSVPAAGLSELSIYTKVTLPPGESWTWKKVSGGTITVEILAVRY